MLKKLLLLRAIENGFDVNKQSYPVFLDYAKEMAVLNYQIYGNTTLGDLPTIDKPVFPSYLGGEEGNNYFKIISISENGEKISSEFFLNYSLRQNGESVDYVDFSSQKAYLYTKIYNIIDLLNETEIKLYKKNEEVIYVSIDYEGDVDEKCISCIWPFSNEPTNEENIGIDKDKSELFFSLSWHRLGINYKNNIAYLMTNEGEKTLNDIEILNIIKTFLSNLPKNNLNVLGSLKNPEILDVFIPPLNLHKNFNKIILTLRNTEKEEMTRLISEDNLVLSTEDGVLVFSNSKEANPSKIIVNYKSFMQ